MTPASKRGSETRDRIVTAALETVRTEGFANTTARAIAAHGGFNQALMTIVKEAGYSTARSIERGVLQSAQIRYHLHVSRIGWKDDVTDLYGGRMEPGLPTFAKRISGANPG